MPKPFSKDNLQPSDMQDEQPQPPANTACNPGPPRKIESVRSRFNVSVVGFGIVGPSTHAPKTAERFLGKDEAGETLGGQTLEDRK
jgi:hypothetical protein